MKIQSRTLKLMTWFLVGVLLALMAVACGQEAAPAATEPEPQETQPETRSETMWEPQTEYLKHREISARAEAIFPKYKDAFECQPNAWRAGITFLEDADGNYIQVPDSEGGYKKVVGFVIRVTEKVPQEQLPQEYRIPDMIEGIPVQILERPLPTWWDGSRSATFDTVKAC